MSGSILGSVDRLDREAARDQAATLWTSTYLLMGLNYPDELIERLLQGVQNMKESVTYQKILKEGRAEEARRILKRQGSRRFGAPSPSHETAIDAIADLVRLEQLTDRVLEVKGWEELLAQP